MASVKTFALSLSAIFWLLSVPIARAQTVGDVANIGALATWTTTGNVNVRNYNTPGDGGGGEFYSTTPGCVGDGGVTITGTGRCWHRQFTGAVHMAWYGVSSATTDASPQLNSALVAAASAGYVVDTDALPLNIGNGTIPKIILPAGVRLTCDAPPGGLRNVPPPPGYSNYTNVPGSLVLAHNQQILLSNANTEFDHCVVLTDGGGGQPINLYPHGAVGLALVREAMNNMENAALNGDTAIFCNAEGCNIHDNLIIGFDTAIEASASPRVWIHNNLADANVGIYLGGSGSIANITDFEMHPFLASGSNYTQTDNFTSVTAAPTTNYCRITIANTANYANGDSIDVTGIPNKLNCNGRSKISKVPLSTTQLDLTDTSYPDPTTTGTFAANTHVIRVASTKGLWAGLGIADSAGYGYIPSSTTVLDVSPYSNAITISNATTNTSPSGTDPLTFSNLNPSGSCMTVTCSALLFGTLRVLAGASDGGTAAGGVGTCLQVGNNVSGTYGNVGLLASNIFCFGHQVEYNMADAGPVNCANCSSDTFAGIDDITRVDLMLGGLNTNSGADHTGRLSWTNSSFAGGGGIIADLEGAGCASLANVAVNPNTVGTLGLDVVNGCVTATGMVDVGNNNAVDVLLETGPIKPGNGTLTGFSFPNSTLFYEQASVAGQFSCANNMGPVGCVNSLPNDLTFASNTAPTCGAGCTIVGGSTNNAMSVQLVAGIASEVITFAGPHFSNAPTCLVNNPSTAATPRTIISSTTPSGFVISFSAATTSTVTVSVLCLGH